MVNIKFHNNFIIQNPQNVNAKCEYKIIVCDTISYALEKNTEWLIL